MNWALNPPFHSAEIFFLIFILFLLFIFTSFTQFYSIQSSFIHSVLFDCWIANINHFVHKPNIIWNVCNVLFIRILLSPLFWLIPDIPKKNSEFVLLGLVNFRYFAFWKPSEEWENHSSDVLEKGSVNILEILLQYWKLDPAVFPYIVQCSAPAALVYIRLWQFFREIIW